MRLAEKLFQLRQSHSWSQEELAEKLNVSRQTISKWETGTSVPDITKIPEIAKLFGVTTDYLLIDGSPVPGEKGAPLTETPQETVQAEAKKLRLLPFSEAEEFLDKSTSFAKRIALGVMMCILSPVVLIVLAGYAGNGFYLTENAAAGLGLTILFLLVAGAVVLFVLSGMRMQKYAELHKGEFLLSPEAKELAAAGRDAFAAKFTRLIAIGVALCILSAMPLIIAAVLAPQPEYEYTLLTGVLLAMVSIGVFLFVYAGIRKESYDRLLQEGCCSPEEREKEKASERFGGIYWPLVTAVYLAWSFLGKAWHISWIVWPVAGLIFAAISAGITGRQKKETK